MDWMMEEDHLWEKRLVKSQSNETCTRKPLVMQMARSKGKVSAQKSSPEDRPRVGPVWIGALHRRANEA